MNNNGQEIESSQINASCASSHSGPSPQRHIQLLYLIFNEGPTIHPLTMETSALMLLECLYRKCFFFLLYLRSWHPSSLHCRPFFTSIQMQKNRSEVLWMPKLGLLKYHCYKVTSLHQIIHAFI